MELQSFLNSTKKITEIKCFSRFWFFTCLHSFSFGTSLFIKRPYVSLHSYSIMLKHVTLEIIIEYVRQKLIKNMRILKFHPGMKCLHVFFFLFFHPRMKSHPCLSSQDQISSRQKRVNSKRHFTIDRDDFIPRRVSSWDEISRVSILYDVIKWLA